MLTCGCISVSVSLCVSVLEQVMACYIAMSYASYCFATFELTDSVREDLDGDWTNFLTPLGWAVIIMFICSSLLLYLFNVMIGQLAKKQVQGQTHPAPAPTAEATVDADAAAAAPEAPPATDETTKP